MAWTKRTIIYIVASFEFESSYILNSYYIKKTWKSTRTASEPLLTQQILQFDISQKSCTIIEYADKIENNNPYYPPIYYMNSLFEIKSNQEHTDDDDEIITMIRALFKSYKNSGYQR